MGAIRTVLNWYSRLTPGRYKLYPPYEHITQIGDPILRNIAETVDINSIKTEEIQRIIYTMKYVMNRYNCVGLSAPQIGVNKRIITIEYKDQYNIGLSNQFLKHRQVFIVPYTVFINPTMKVLDFTVVLHPEGCESVKGYQANVPRYQAVQVTGYNEKAEQVTKDYEGWAARMVQHEIDHLDGKFYTDIMEKRSLECVCWEEVNLSRGKVRLPFYA